MSPGTSMCGPQFSRPLSFQCVSSHLGRYPRLELSIEYLHIVKYEAPSNRHLNFLASRFQVNPTGNSRHPPLPGDADGHHWDRKRQQVQRCHLNRPGLGDTTLAGTKVRRTQKHTWRNGYCFFIQKLQEKFCFILVIGSYHSQEIPSELFAF